MTTLYFSKLFTRGLLKGIVYHGFLDFTDPERAASWIKGIRKNIARGKLNFDLVDATFQARRVDHG